LANLGIGTALTNLLQDFVAARTSGTNMQTARLARFVLADCPLEVSLIDAVRAGRVLEMKLPTKHGFDVTAQIRFNCGHPH
jgi:hypothetical protein